MEKRNYEQSKKLDNVCYDIRGPVMDEAMRMEARGANILKLNIGNPAPFGFYAPDEVILAMREVGDKMDVSLKETGVGGVAGTPFGQKIAEKMGMA